MVIDMTVRLQRAEARLQDDGPRALLLRAQIEALRTALELMTGALEVLEVLVEDET